MAEIETTKRDDFEEEDYDVHFLDSDPDGLALIRPEGALALIAPSYMVFDAKRQLTYWSIRPEDDCVDFARLFHPGLVLEDLIDKAIKFDILDTEGVELRKYIDERLAQFATGTSSFPCKLVGDRWFRISDKRTEDGITITSIVNVTAIERHERAVAVLLGDYQTGLPLFERAARALTIGLGFQTASVARLINPEEAETIANLHHGVPVLEQRRFSIRGTPCEPLYRAGYFAFSGDFLRRFPLINFDGYFMDIGHGSYIGQVVFGRDGQALGHVLALDETERPFDDGDRRLVRMVADYVAYELQHLAATQAAKTSQARLADFTDSAHEAFFETDANLICTFASVQAESVTGMGAVAWIGQPMSELGPAGDAGWQSCLDDIAQHRAFDGVKFPFGRPGGSNARLSFSGKPLFDTRGKFTGYRFAALPMGLPPVVVSHPKTNDDMSQVLGSSLEGVALFNTDYKLVFGNDKFLNLLFGDRQEKVKPGMSLAQLSYLWLPNGSDAERRQLMKFHLENDALGSDYLDIVTADHRTLRAIRRRTEEGGLATAYLDISDLKQREDELEHARDAALEANSTKSMFLANVSHELRTPLNAIIGFADIMREQLLGPMSNPRYFEYVQDIRSSGEHLLDMINDILDLSKAEAGELELAYEMVDVGEVMNAVVRLMSEQAESSKLHFVALSPVGLRKIRADKRRIKQVLINLISNAIKFTPAGGTIELSARTEDRAVKITVNDTGIGIAPDEIARVMTPFGQIDSQISRQHKGTGLGLPLAKRLVELHGGELVITSEPNRGTKVSVSFPFNTPAKSKTGKITDES